MRKSINDRIETVISKRFPHLTGTDQENCKKILIQFSSTNEDLVTRIIHQKKILNALQKDFKMKTSVRINYMKEAIDEIHSLRASQKKLRAEYNKHFKDYAKLDEFRKWQATESVKQTEKKAEAPKNEQKSTAVAVRFVINRDQTIQFIQAFTKILNEYRQSGTTRNAEFLVNLKEVPCQLLFSKGEKVDISK